MGSTGLRLLLVGLVVGSILSGPTAALSKDRGTCPRFDPVEPSSDSGQTDEAPSARLIRIGRDETKTDPWTADYEIGTNVWLQGVDSNDPIVEDTKFVNLQVSGEVVGEATLNAKLTWDTPRQLEDLDLFIYDSNGIEADRSTKPMGQPVSKELVSVRAARCRGFTVEVRALHTLQTTATLHVWLSKSA